MESTEKGISILMVDDHQLVRQGLIQILAGEPDMQVVGDAASAGQALEELSVTAFDVVVMDVSMPGPNTRDALQEILKRWPDQRVLMISMHPEDQYAMHFIKAGAAGYITKSDAPQDLARAIRTVADNKCYVSDELSAQLKLLEQGDGI